MPVEMYDARHHHTDSISDVQKSVFMSDARHPPRVGLGAGPGRPVQLRCVLRVRLNDLGDGIDVALVACTISNQRGTPLKMRHRCEGRQG